MPSEKLLFHSPTEEKNFISYIDFQENCWVWTGATQRGYGSFRLRGNTCRPHRIVWANYVDPELPDYPVGMLDHIKEVCDNRACVNPDHLEPVTQWENVVERGTGITAENARKTHCPEGHEYSGVNSHGRRICRICQRKQLQESRDRQIARYLELIKRRNGLK